MSFSPASAVLAPGQTFPVAVTIVVPRDATTGERYAAALGQYADPTTGGVSMVSRVGIRLYLSIGPGGAPATSFKIESMAASRAKGGAPVVTAQVHNTGGRAVDLAGSLRLTNGPSALSAGPFSVDQTVTLAPGQSGSVTVTLDRVVPRGPWDARLSLASGLTTSSATARLTFPVVGGPSGPSVKVFSAAVFAEPLVAMVAGGLLVAIVGLSIPLIRRRRRRRAARTV